MADLDDGPKQTPLPAGQVQLITAELLAGTGYNLMLTHGSNGDFPYFLPNHADWRPRYERFNRPGEYHNGGVWPFVCGFHVAVCATVVRMGLTGRQLLALTELGGSPSAPR
jgi:hypothetical protein